MKRSVLSLLPLVILAFFLNGCGLGDKSADEYIASARNFQSKGDIKASIIELKNALRQSPDNVEARMLLGTLYLDAGDAESAEKELQRSMELGVAPQKVVIPLLQAQLLQAKFQEVLDYNLENNTLEKADQAMLLVLRGNAQLGLGELDAARKMFDAARALQPRLAEAGLGRARIAAARGDSVTARRILNNVVKFHDDFAPGWSLLGDLEQYEGNMAVAEARYSKALKLRPGNIYDLANRGLTRVAQNNLPGAASDIGAAVSRNAQQSRKQPLVYYAQGQLSLATKDYEEAVKLFDETLEVVPDFLPARYFLAVAQYRSGSFEQAEQTLGPYRNKAPQNVAGHKLFAAIKVSQGQYDIAQTELENILSFDPDDVWALDLLADVAVLKGNPEQSIENYQKIVDLQPDSAPARLNLALSLMMSGAMEAGKVLKDSVATGNASPQTNMLLMVSNLMAKQWDEAIDAGNRLVSEDTGNWDAFTLLGGAYLGKGDSEKAREMFQQALKLSPGNPNAANNLARLELNAKNEAAARSLYEQILERHPTETSALLSLGALDSRHGKFQDAIARIEAGLNKKPQDLSLRVALARLYLRTGQPSKCIDLVFEAPKEKADNPLMLQLLGDSQFALGNFEAATESYEKLVRLAPESATAHYLLARAYAGRKQLDRAEEQLQKVIDLEPQHFAASVLRIRLLRLDRKEQEALKLLKELDPTYSNRPEVLIEKGWLALYQNDNAEAIRAFERAFELVPSNDLVIQLGIAKWNSGDQAGALAGYKSWLQANPTDTLVQFHLANGYLQLGRNDEAVAAFQKVLEQKPDDPIILNNLAWLLRDSNPKEALEYAKRTASITPEWAAGIDTLGMIYLGQGDTTQAYRFFEQALQKSPEDREIRYHLALASSRMGEKEQASQILKAILSEPAAKFESRNDAEKLLISLKQ